MRLILFHFLLWSLNFLGVFESSTFSQVLVVHVFSPSIQKAEGGSSLWVQCQPGATKWVPGQSGRLHPETLSWKAKQQQKPNKRVKSSTLCRFIPKLPSFVSNLQSLRENCSLSSLSFNQSGVAFQPGNSVRLFKINNLQSMVQLHWEASFH